MDNNRYLIIISDCPCGSYVVGISSRDIYVSDEAQSVSFEKKEKIIARLKQKRLDYEVIKV